MCEDLVSMQCIVRSIGMLVVRVEPDGIWPYNPSMKNVGQNIDQRNDVLS